MLKTSIAATFAAALVLNTIVTPALSHGFHGGGHHGFHGGGHHGFHGGGHHGFHGGGHHDFPGGGHHGFHDGGHHGGGHHGGGHHGGGHHGHHHGHGYYGGWDHWVPGVAIGTALALGTALSYQPSGCTFTYVNGISYCYDSYNWYRVENGRYVVVPRPQ